MPPNTIYVGRPSRFGNPYTFGHAVQFRPGVNTVLTTRAGLVRAYREYIFRCLDSQSDWLAPLRGKDLACWCKLSDECHADALLDALNAEHEEVMQKRQYERS
jgi:hypothetical protein